MPMGHSASNDSRRCARCNSVFIPDSGLDKVCEECLLECERCGSEESSLYRLESGEQACGDCSEYPEREGGIRAENPEELRDMWVPPESRD